MNWIPRHSSLWNYKTISRAAVYSAALKVFAEILCGVPAWAVMVVYCIASAKIKAL
jgi:hypothetical protein